MRKACVILSIFFICMLLFATAFSYAQVTVTANVPILVPAQCSDGIDNDGDTKIDYPNDPGCDSFSDNDETDGVIPSPTPSILPGGGGGGGGGGGPTTGETRVVFKGRAYPGSTIHIFKNSEKIGITKAGPDARFEITQSNLSPGSYIFGMWSEDASGNKSLTLSFSLYVTSGITTVVSGIFISPTIRLDKVEVKRGDGLTVFGQAAPHASVKIFFNSEITITKEVQTDEFGSYQYRLNSRELDVGDHSAQSRAFLEHEQSDPSQLAFFKVGTKNISAQTLCRKGDFNCDGKVNLIDYSITAYWYKRVLTQNAKKGIDLNNDGKVDLKDFSILAYYWTG